jgi:hypothetical protein
MVVAEECEDFASGVMFEHLTGLKIRGYGGIL